jgi:hypothetical protein
MIKEISDIRWPWEGSETWLADILYVIQQSNQIRISDKKRVANIWSAHAYKTIQKWRGGPSITSSLSQNTSVVHTHKSIGPRKRERWRRWAVPVVDFRQAICCGVALYLPSKLYGGTSLQILTSTFKFVETSNLTRALHFWKRNSHF